ncbi:hypothetical protein HIM_08531 [Hirsutella minnesotensis 3608]|uniref:NAD dependent epimerase/dehydratase n=1 Tax=Hirsutella minnesotensis 3608 TaxID=1043627 RepID=A0A0F7ZH60_9HYPO|nr:hypothetical protein HIM_08531 [Hirsutella minnesotensis 3608]
MGSAPSVPTDKSRKLQVIGAGASRTGTLSLSLALERLLDGPVMHGGTQIIGREDAYVRLMYETIHQRHNTPILMKRLESITAGFLGVTDTPASSFVPELLELYPDAKVVLVTRDPKKWLQSFDPLLKACSPWWVHVLLWPCPGLRWFPGFVKELMKREAERIPSYVVGGPVTTDMLEEHHARIKKLTPTDKLLVMRLDEGWEPLCRFLDKPIPAEPFPHVNDREALAEVIRRTVATCIMIWICMLIAIGFLFNVVRYFS